MPRVVDHDERRAMLVGITARQIAEVGLGGIRLRDVARAAGLTTGAVSHYFPDKRTLLLLTFRGQTKEAAERILRTAGDDELAPYVEALLPLDEERALHWHVWLAFWGAAIGDAELAEEQRQRQERFVDGLADRVRAGQRSGRLRADLDVTSTARFVAALVDGVAVQATFAPASWPPDVQRCFVDDRLAALRAGPPRRSGPPRQRRRTSSAASRT